MPYTDSGASLSNTTAEGVNILDKYQSFNALFTLAAMSKNQLNGSTVDRGSVQNIICRSQGIGSGGTDSGFGKFDYFIDDVIISSVPSLSKKTGNTFGTKITFKVFEPYSMGLFMLTMQKAASNAGYGQSFKEAPYLFMIEFIGYVNGQPGSSEPGTELVRYIPVKIIEIKFNVGQTGSTYLVTAIPYNEEAFREKTVRSVTDIKLAGKTVGELLQKGIKDKPETSLMGALRERHDEEKKSGRIQDWDEIIIAFPRDYQDPSPGQDNDISKSVVYDDLSNNGVQLMPDLKDIFDDKRQIYRTPLFKLEKDRVWHFVQEVTILDIINEVVLRSEYIQKQVISETNSQGQQTFSAFKHDANGMINWFRVEVYTKDLDYTPSLGRQKREYTYRVIPYKVHIHRFLPPGQKPPGYGTLKNTVARIYDYIYTGKNTEILNLEINFDMAYFTPVPFDASENVGQNNPSQGGILAGGPPLFYQFTQGQGLGQSAELNVTQVPAAQRQYHSKGQGGSGSDNEKTSQVRTMQAILTNKGDMLNLNMEIMGDPYYIPSTGMGNIIVGSKGENLTNEGSMNYQNGEVHIQINFRTPIDLDPTTGLYKFEKGIDVWSGLYQVIGVESKFNGGKFTQNIAGIRLRAQLGSQESQEKRNILTPRKEGQNNQGGTPNKPYAAGSLNPETGGYTGGDGGQVQDTGQGPGGVPQNAPPPRLTGETEDVIRRTNPDSLPNFGQTAPQVGIPQTPGRDWSF